MLDMIDILQFKDFLILKYEPRNLDTDDTTNSYIKNIVSSIDSGETFPLKRVFYFKKEDSFYDDDYIISNSVNVDTTISFKIGEINDDYWQIYTHVLDINHNIYFHKDYQKNITPYTFIYSYGNDIKKSIFKEIFEICDEDIWIGGQKENAISTEIFDLIIARFPSVREISLYTSKRVSLILKEYFDPIVDFEKKYEKYIEKKRINIQKVTTTLSKTNVGSFSDIFSDSEYQKYEIILSELKEMLKKTEEYDEKQWQNKMLDIIPLIYPKYVVVLKEVKINDVYSKKERRIDFLLIDTNGNSDIIEIKKPYSDKNLMVSRGQYRDNYVPIRDLSGAIMQIEKYIFYLNKWGKSGEDILTKKHKDQLPNGVSIKFTNPNGIVIMGRDTGMNNEQKADFEIIKRKYHNIVDILSYDDLIHRLEIILAKFRKKL